MTLTDAEELDVTWWLSPIEVTDEGPRLERAHGDWVWPQAHRRLGASLQRIGEGGRYELIGLLNRGGQAYLWAARDHEANDALVVVKTVHPRTDDSVAGARLTREARLLELLAGEPTVMSVLDWGPGRLRGGPHGEFETERPWLVLPYRAHISLDRALILSGGRLSTDAAWQIGHDLGTALRHLHAANVVHRDLSLRNLLLTPTGCVLADLGMAWASSMVDQEVEEQFTTGITQQQNRGVTWGWLAPEAARPPKDGRRPDREPAADVFGWGLHMFCALTGRHPWAAYGLRPSEDELYAMYDVAARPSLAALERDDVPKSVQRLVTAALAEQPEDRPSAAELLAELGSSRPSLAATQSQLSTLRGQIEDAERAARARGERRAARPGLDGRPDAAAPLAAGTIPDGLAAGGSRGGWRRTLTGSRAKLVAGLLAAAVVLAVGATGAVRANGQAADAVRNRDAARAFPLAMDAVVSLERESAFSAVLNAKARRAARASTDAALRGLAGELSGPAAREPNSAEATARAELSTLRGALPKARQRMDTLSEQAPGRLNDSAFANQVTVGFTTLNATAVSMLTDLADAMKARTADRATIDATDAARASALAAVATDDMSRVASAVLYRQRSMTVDTLRQYSTGDAQQGVLLSQVGDLISNGEERRALAVIDGLDQVLRQWTASLTNTLDDPDAFVGDQPAFEASMHDRINRLSALAGLEARQVRERQDTLAGRLRTEMVRDLAIAIGLAVLIALLTLPPRRRRSVPVRPAVLSGSPSGSGNDSKAPDFRVLAPEPQPVSLFDA